MFLVWGVLVNVCKGNCFERCGPLAVDLWHGSYFLKWGMLKASWFCAFGQNHKYFEKFWANEVWVKLVSMGLSYHMSTHEPRKWAKRSTPKSIFYFRYSIVYKQKETLTLVTKVFAWQRAAQKTHRPCPRLLSGVKCGQTFSANSFTHVRYLTDLLAVTEKRD